MKKKTETDGVDRIEAAIKDIADGARKIMDSDLTDRAIILLIQNACSPKPPRQIVAAVLEAARTLDVTYLKSRAEESNS